MRIILSLLSVAVFSSPVFAKPVITAIAGASNHTLTGTITAFGGFAGPACSHPDNNNFTCDNCAAGALTACNSQRAYGNLILTVTATHAETSANNLIMAKSDLTTTVPHASPLNTNAISVLWNQVCIALGTGGNTDCENATIKEGTVKICADKDNSGTYTSGDDCEDLRIRISLMPPGTADLATADQGVTDYVPYPGDEKIYLKDIIKSPNFPNLIGGKVGGVRVFIGQTNMTDAKPQAGLTPKDLRLMEDGVTLDNSIVDGLENGVRYWFRIALIDEANNIGYFWPDDNFVDADGANCDQGPCRYSVMPDEVVGMLTDDVNCFIASAAYGTSMNDKLDTFREFRFKRLLPTEWGRRMVKAYYHYGPYAARYIHDKPALRAVTRGLLWPAYGFSHLALRFGLSQAVAISLFAMTALIALPLLGVRRFFPRA